MHKIDMSLERTAGINLYLANDAKAVTGSVNDTKHHVPIAPNNVLSLKRKLILHPAHWQSSSCCSSCSCRN